MDREFDYADSGRSPCGANCRHFWSPVLVIFVWALALCSPAVAKASTPAVSVSATSLYFGSYSVGTKGGPENLWVTNSGKARLTISSIALTGGNAGDFTQTNNCRASLAAGANCFIQVMFKPTAPGTRTTVLNIKDNATGSPQKVTFSGTATASAPAVSLSATSLTFGNYAVGATALPQNLFVTNFGNAPLAFTSIALTGNNASDFVQTNNCGGSLAAGANCLVQVIFKPFAAGSRTTTLSIADNATGSPQKVALSGTATAGAPTVSLSAASLYFGYYAAGTTGGPENLFITNSGNSPLTLTSITLTGANASDFTQTNNCGGSLTPSASCLVQVMFKPSATGTRTTILSIADNATGSPQTVSLSGTGTSAVASVFPTSLTFGSQSVGATGTAQAVTVNNTGNAALNITSIAVSGANAGDFALTNSCGTSVAAGANCTISVTFKPTVTGTRSAAVTIADSASSSPQTVGLSGTGTASTVSVSPTNLSFGSQSVGTTSSAQMITLTNSGNVALTISSLTISGANPGDFTQTSNCGSNVAAGANCTIGVTFLPSASGSRAASLSIADSASGSPQIVSFGGNGTSTSDGVSLAPGNLVFSNQPVEMTSTAQTVTLTNNGTTSLSISSFTLTGANSADFVQNNNCSSSVAAGANCTIVVLFIPSAIGARAAALSITDSSAGSPQIVSLLGTGSNDVILAWTASSTQGVIGYNIYRGTTSGGESATALNSTPINGTNFTDETVTPGLTYYYLATSVPSSGGTQSAASAETSATVPSL